MSTITRVLEKGEYATSIPDLFRELNDIVVTQINQWNRHLL